MSLWGALTWRNVAFKVLTCVLTVVLCGGSSYMLLRTQNTVDKVFGGGAVTTTSTTETPTTTTAILDTVVPDSEPSGGTSTTESTTTAAPVPSGPSWAVDGRWNVLFIGADAGQGRYGARADSMIVVSIDIVTGDTALLSVPRNVTSIDFPNGTYGKKQYPSGFDDLANAVFGWGMKNFEKLGGVDAYGGGSIATAQVVSELTGLRIDDWIVVDMEGFTDVIDAVGGVDVCVPAKVPLPPAIHESKTAVPAYLEEGCQHLNGTIALAYSRTRSADSDYQRTARQRLVVEALFKQFSTSNVLMNFSSVLDAVEGTVRTSIPQSRIDDSNNVFSIMDTENIRSFGLVPPFFKPNDYETGTVHLAVYEFVYLSQLP